MAFTAEEKSLIYVSLGLFEGGTFDWYSYHAWWTEGIAAIPISQHVDFTTATTKLDAIIAAIELTGTGRMGLIKELLARFKKIWIAVPWKIDTGGTISTPGLRMHMMDGLSHYKRQLETMIGIHIEVSNSPWTTGQSRSISLVR